MSLNKLKLTLLKRPRKRSLAKVDVGFDVWSKQRSNGVFTSLQAPKTCLPALNDSMIAGVYVVFGQKIQNYLHHAVNINTSHIGRPLLSPFPQSFAICAVTLTPKYGSHIEWPSRKLWTHPQSFPFLRGRPERQFCKIIKIFLANSKRIMLWRTHFYSLI